MFQSSAVRFFRELWEPFFSLRFIIVCHFHIFSDRPIIVPVHFSGGKNYILEWVFLFRQFWPFDIIIVGICEWNHSKARTA